MMSPLRVLVAVLALALLASACAGSSDAASAPTPDSEPTVVAEQPTEVPAAVEPTVEPTGVPPTEIPATPEPESLSEQARIDAAVAAFEGDPRPSDLIAWDHLDAQSLGDRVRLTVCGWTGVDVFDSTYLIEYGVEVDADGEPVVDYLFDGTTADDCLNTELIDSALAATRAYDDFWAPVLSDPTTFDLDAALAVSTPEHASLNAESANNWVRDGLNRRGFGIDGDLPDSAVNGVAWRRFLTEEQGSLVELLACRDLGADSGFYRGDLLVDDGKGDNSSGTHEIYRYRLTRQMGEWRVFGITTNTWADCFEFTPTFIEFVNEWQPEPTAWEDLEDA